MTGIEAALAIIVTAVRCAAKLAGCTGKAATAETAEPLGYERLFRPLNIQSRLF